MSSAEDDRRLVWDWTLNWSVPADARDGSPAPADESERGVGSALPIEAAANGATAIPVAAAPEFGSSSAGSATAAAHAAAGLESTEAGLAVAAPPFDLDQSGSLHFTTPSSGLSDLTAGVSPIARVPAQSGLPASEIASFQTGAPIATGHPPALSEPAAVRQEHRPVTVSGKLDGLLTSLLPAHSAHVAVHSSPALPGSIHGKYVTIDATAKDGNGDALLAELRLIGLAHGAAYGGMASGEMPIARLAAMQALPDLSFAREDALVTGKISPLPAQAAQALGTTASGVVTTRGGNTIDGTGVTVGILSDSFNTSGGADTMKTDIAKGYLPANTHILQDWAGGTDEGRAMAEIVHEIAPGASILFATAFNGEAAFAANIVALAKAGAKVIVDDVSYFAEPAYQDGVIAQAVNYVTSHYGVTYFSAAGNAGSNGYEGRFTRGVHDGRWTFDNFTPGHGQHDSIPVTIPAGDEVVFVLEWAQPAASASPGHGAKSELDLFLVRSGGAIVSQSRDRTIGHDPFQAIDYVNHLGHARTLYLDVGLHAGSMPRDFKLMALDDGAGVRLGSYASNRNHGTIYGHPAAAGAVSVGADFIGDTPAFGTDPPVTEYYSSTGPTDIYFQPNGTAFASPIVRSGPGLMAPDGADTSFLGFQIQDGDTLPNFFGTSAAAPAAAAVDALIRQADPLLTASQGVDILQSTALYQPDSVAGLIQADVAVNLAWDLYA